MRTVTGRWYEQAPLGPTMAGDVGGDIQAGEAYSRRWSRPIPMRPGWMVVTVTMYACEDRGRRWVQTAIEFARVARLDDEIDPFDTRYEDSAEDGPADEAWPSDDDVRTLMAGYPVAVHDDWDGR